MLALFIETIHAGDKYACKEKIISSSVELSQNTNPDSSMLLTHEHCGDDVKLSAGAAKSLFILNTFQEGRGY